MSLTCAITERVVKLSDKCVKVTHEHRHLHSGTSSQQSHMSDPHSCDSWTTITGWGCLTTIVEDIMATNRMKQELISNMLINATVTQLHSKSDSISNKYLSSSTERTRLSFLNNADFLWKCVCDFHNKSQSQLLKLLQIKSVHWKSTLWTVKWPLKSVTSL